MNAFKELVTPRNSSVPVQKSAQHLLSPPSQDAFFHIRTVVLRHILRLFQGREREKRESLVHANAHKRREMETEKV